MKKRKLALVCLLYVGSIISTTVNAAGPSQEAIDTAIRKSIPLLETTAAGSSQHRQCFTCHGHAMPILALVAAKGRGFTIDEKNLQAQLDHTAADLARGKANYLKGRGQGGGHTRAGYALWTLHTGHRKPDDVTAAVTAYLVFDEKADHWKSSANRPPSEKSPFASTYVALRGLDAFGTNAQAKRIDMRKQKALSWLLHEQATDTEDRVFRLLSLGHLAAAPDAVKPAAEQLIKTQQQDGGWSQITDAKSDAYATGSVLFALHQAAGISIDHDVYQRGVKFLLGDQLEDGSWHVRSRSKPFQTYYESGFPHGKDQFISMHASSWATLALLLTHSAER